MRRKKPRCTPVHIEDLVGGQLYIRVLVPVHLQLYIGYFVPHGRPWREAGDWFYRKGSTLEQGKRCVDRNKTGWAALDGLDSESRMYRAYFTRSFRFTARNDALLKGMVDRNNLAAYLALIGYQNVPATLEWALAWKRNAERMGTRYMLGLSPV